MEIDTQDAEDEIKSLTGNLPPETAQHILQLKIAMKSASEDELNAVLKMLSNKPPDSEEKSRVEPEGSATLDNTNVDSHNGLGSHKLLLEVSDNNEEVGDCEENSADKDLSVDAMGQEERKNGYDADEAPLDQACVTSDTNDDPDSVDKSVITPNEDQKLHELSNEAEEVEDDLSNTNENSADVLQESASSSEDEEEIPELLSKKADDVSSGMEFIDDEGLVERLSDRVEINGTSLVEETSCLQQAPISNSVPLSFKTEITEKNDMKIDEGESLSSDDDQVVSTSPSSHSVVMSSESDLSEAAAPNDSFQVVQSDGINDDIRNEEMAPGISPINSSKDDGIAVIEDGVSHLEAKNEPESVTVPVLERTLSISSTGTQTSCENLHLAKDQSFNTFELEYGNLDSILSGNEKGSSKLPFYYQPKIVMHGEKPILVLQPVSSTTPSSDKNDGVAGVENGAVKASVPIILPLASPVIDKATKDAIFQQINGTAASPFKEEEDEECYTKNSFSESSSSGVSPSVIPPMSQQNGTEGDMQLNALGHEKPVYKSIPVAEKCFETSESEETENLPEWVPASELDKAFSAAAKETLDTTKDQTPVTLTFPVVSLPSTNPFAKDLADQEYRCSDVKEGSLLNFGSEQMQHSSLFGPPSSPSLSQGARPKTYQDPGRVGSATNPFVPDLTPKKQGRRQEQKPADATEVVISAEVHPSVGYPTEIHSTQPNFYRHRMSSESMVTLIETSYADTSLTSFESLGVNEPQKIAQVEVKTPQPQSRETSQATEKPKLHVPGKVAPIWMPDFGCYNCTACNIKFTLFIRKHHCRGCGKIFCNSCCSQLARFPYMDFKIGRVCSSCAQAIREVTHLKKKEDSSKPTPGQQSTVKSQGAASTPGLPPEKFSASQTRPLPQGVVVTNGQAQRKATTPPFVQIQRSAAPSAAVVSSNQPRGISNQPVQYQPLTLPQKPTAGMQNTATPLPVSNPSAAVLPLNQGLQPAQYQPLSWSPMSTANVKKSATPVAALVPSNQLQQPSQGLIMPAQPANQYMWVPASAIQQSMPVVYANPVAPSLQGGPMFVSYPQAGQFIPQQPPVVLMTSQPSSTLGLPQTTTSMQAAVTMSNGRGKGVTPVSNRPSGGTVTTFSVLPQHVGQSAVQSAQRNNVVSVRQPATTAYEASVGHAMPSISKQPVVPSFPQSSHQTTSLTSQLPTNTLPITSSPHQPPTPSVTTASLSQRLPDAAVSRFNESSQSHETVNGSSRSRESGGSVLVADEPDSSSKDFHLPLRRAGRTITWRDRTQGKSKLQEVRKSLSKDLRDLPNGITVQASQDLLVHIKKIKLKEGERDISVWCYQSDGLNKFNHLEVVVMLEIRKKEDVFPEEVLRVYRGILHLAKLENRFEHGNYLSSNNQFLDSSDDAAFIFVSSELKSKPQGLREMKAPFLYGILVKRSELSAAMFTPSRLLLQLGNKMRSFPFPLWNNRDRRAINLGNQQDDRFFHTLFAMNKYLKNSVPEAMVPGLYVVKEDNKIILQVPSSGQSAIVGLLDRLVKKEDQTATVPLLADIPPYVDKCKIVVCNERGGNTVKTFGNTVNKSVVGLSFLLLHLGVDASSPLSFGGELLDDGVLLFFSKSHTQKLRGSLATKSNCYFFLGDKFNIAHFELRWVPDVNYHELPKPTKHNSPETTDNQLSETTTADTTAKETAGDSYPGTATIDIRYSGYGNEVELLKKVFDDTGKILLVMEGNIRQACTDPLMKHANKMRPGENQELQLRVVLRSSYKKWSVRPSDLPTALIRSLQMALHMVKVPVVFEGELVMSFDVSVVKQ